MPRSIASLIFAVAVYSALVVACAVPQTPRQSLAALELSFQQTIYAIEDFATDHPELLSDDDNERLQRAVDLVFSDLAAWEASPDDLSLASTTNSDMADLLALTALWSLPE